MRQSFAITLIIGALFLLWLFNTGRWERFASAFGAAWNTTGTGGGTGGGIVPINPNAPANPLGPGFGVRPTSFVTSTGGLAPGAVFGGGYLAGTPGYNYSGVYGAIGGIAGGQGQSDPSAQGLPCAGQMLGGVFTPGCINVAFADVFRYPGQTLKDVGNTLLGWTGIKF